MKIGNETEMPTDKIDDIEVVQAIILHVYDVLKVEAPMLVQGIHEQLSGSPYERLWLASLVADEHKPDMAVVWVFRKIAARETVKDVESEVPGVRKLVKDVLKTFED